MDTGYATEYIPWDETQRSLSEITSPLSLGGAELLLNLLAWKMLP